MLVDAWRRESVLWRVDTDGWGDGNVGGVLAKMGACVGVSSVGGALENVELVV